MRPDFRSPLSQWSELLHPVEALHLILIVLAIAAHDHVDPYRIPLRTSQEQNIFTHGFSFLAERNPVVAHARRVIQHGPCHLNLEWPSQPAKSAMAWFSRSGCPKVTRSLEYLARAQDPPAPCLPPPRRLPHGRHPHFMKIRNPRFNSPPRFSFGMRTSVRTADRVGAAVTHLLLRLAHLKSRKACRNNENGDAAAALCLRSFYRHQGRGRICTVGDKCLGLS